MPNYRIIGVDLKEYGPASAEQIRQWMTEGRVDSQTKLQAEGGGEWKLLAEMPEFAAPLKGNDPQCCPKCGEPFVKGFDSCWKCGTYKDGSPPKKWAPVADAAEGVAEPCPKCGSSNVTLGRLLPSEGGISATFRPAGARIFTLSLARGVDLCTDPSSACLDCGLVWSYLRPEELKEFISKHCTGPAKEDAYALLSEGARLESQGDTPGALAKYAAVMERFPGTDAARDAEFNIGNLTAGS